MKKKIMFGLMATSILPNLTLADTGYGMMGSGSYGMMGSFSMGLLWILYLALGSLVFSLIFWAVYKSMVKENKRKRR